jgi:hypothetical protein
MDGLTMRALSLLLASLIATLTGAHAAPTRSLPETKQMNAIRVIYPYKQHGTWVFDDERVGLVREPFVAGADTVIDHMVANIPDAERGFTLLFAATPFPGHNAQFERRRQEHGGTWYYSPQLDMEGWLCPALFKYFEQAPERLYVQFKAKG